MNKTLSGLVYGLHDSPFGSVLIALFQERLCGVAFRGNLPGSLFFEQAQRHLRAPLAYYAPDATRSFVDPIFRGELPPVLLGGTDFQLKVWRFLRTIPEKKVMTYQEVAEELCVPRAVRSVGQALKANPLAYVLPCHRVISTSGKLGGYRWSAEVKARILSAEGSI